MSQSPVPSSAKIASPGERLRFLVPPTEGVIRLAGEADLRGLEWHGGTDLRSFYRELWAEHVKGRATLLVADFNKFPIGMAATYWDGKSTLPHVPDLQSLRVMPAFRGLGIGSFLLEAAERLAHEQGHSQISLSVGLDNRRARRLYERREYSVIGSPYQFAWSYENAAGRRIRVEETVVDMVKSLGEET